MLGGRYIYVASILYAAARRDVLDAHPDDIAASTRAIDRKVEKGEVVLTADLLELDADHQTGWD